MSDTQRAGVAPLPRTQPREDAVEILSQQWPELCEQLEVARDRVLHLVALAGRIPANLRAEEVGHDYRAGHLRTETLETAAAAWQVINDLYAKWVESESGWALETLYDAAKEEDAA